MPLHVLLMSILIGIVGFPPSALRLVAAWKEVLLVSGLLILVAGVLQQTTVQFKLAIPDLFVLGFFGLATLYLLLPSPSNDAGLVSKLYGYREAFLPVALYCLGRLIVVTHSDVEKILKWILVVGLITSIIGILERFLVPLEFHSRIGAAKYYADFIGVDYSRNLFGLPENYWQWIGGRTIRRAVSTHMSSQPFATSFLVFSPISIWYAFTKAGRRWGAALIVVGMVALLLTITRMTIIVVVIQSALMLLLLKRHRYWIGLALVCCFAFASAMLLYSDEILGFVNRVLFSTTHYSTASHLDTWKMSLGVLRTHPFGYGLGTSGLAAVRFGIQSSGGESQYFDFSGAMGIPGVLGYVGVLLSLAGYFGYWYPKIPKRARGVVVCGLVATVGYALNNITAALHGQLFITYVYWWLAGMVVQYASRSGDLAKRQSLPGVPLVEV